VTINHEVFYPATIIFWYQERGYTTMGIFDEINKAMKKVEEEVRKADMDKQFRGPGDGTNNAGSNRTEEIDTAETPTPQQPSTPVSPSAVSARRPHPGYSRITAWVKSRYKGKIAGAGDPYQKRLELEQISAEACGGLSAKVKKGFLEYLKSQNYEQLLK
jgi:hypothetical protein